MQQGLIYETQAEFKVWMHSYFHNKLITRIVFLKSFRGAFPKSNYGLLDNPVITKSSMEIMTNDGFEKRTPVWQF